MVLAHDITVICSGKTLILVVAVEGFAIEAGKEVKAKPQVALRVLGDAPTIVVPLRRRRLLVLLEIAWN